MAAIYAFVKSNLTLLISILIYLLVVSQLFLRSPLERFAGISRLLALLVVAYLILFEVDPTGYIVARVLGLD